MCWIEFEDHVGPRTFHIYSSLDGRKLAPCQCVIARHEWNEVRARFLEAFLLQKKAWWGSWGQCAETRKFNPCLNHEFRVHLDLDILSSKPTCKQNTQAELIQTAGRTTEHSKFHDKYIRGFSHRFCSPKSSSRPRPTVMPMAAAQPPTCARTVGRSLRSTHGFRVPGGTG